MSSPRVADGGTAHRSPSSSRSPHLPTARDRRAPQPPGPSSARPPLRTPSTHPRSLPGYLLAFLLPDSGLCSSVPPGPLPAHAAHRAPAAPPGAAAASRPAPAQARAAPCSALPPRRSLASIADPLSATARGASAAAAPGDGRTLGLRCRQSTRRLTGRWEERRPPRRSPPSRVGTGAGSALPRCSPPRAPSARSCPAPEGPAGLRFAFPPLRGRASPADPGLCPLRAGSALRGRAPAPRRYVTRRTRRPRSHTPAPRAPRPADRGGGGGGVGAALLEETARGGRGQRGRRHRPAPHAAPHAAPVRAHAPPPRAAPAPPLGVVRARGGGEGRGPGHGGAVSCAG
ncbi:skin secretory protein xP2-like [Molothrus aeneus]|uniref:skin secretory protein xP2-like n=1 Tax=Molothrus aeneus TaxID=84833 RepID=UPI0034583AF7